MSIKINKAVKHYTGFKGAQTVTEILEQIPDELVKSLSSKQIAQVMAVVDGAYHNGKASAGAELIDSNCVWVESLNKGIEWSEVGAEFEQVTETLPASEFSPSSKVTKSVKIKNGTLVANFID